jgi:hypothetical protein
MLMLAAGCVEPLAILLIGFHQGQRSVVIRLGRRSQVEWHCRALIWSGRRAVSLPAEISHWPVFRRCLPHRRAKGPISGVAIERAATIGNGSCAGRTRCECVQGERHRHRRVDGVCQRLFKAGNVARPGFSARRIESRLAIEAFGKLVTRPQKTPRCKAPAANELLFCDFGRYS